MDGVPQLARCERRGSDEVRRLSFPRVCRSDRDDARRRACLFDARDEIGQIATMGAVAKDGIDPDQPEGFERLGIAGGGEDGYAAERPGETGAQRVVRCHEESRLHLRAGASATATSGNSTVKTAPPPRRFAARSLARCEAAIAAQIVKPRPEPRCRVLKNGSNTCSSDSAGMPGPVSVTVTANWASVARTVITTEPSGGVASSPLISRLMKSCSISP